MAHRAGGAGRARFKQARETGSPLEHFRQTEVSRDRTPGPTWRSSADARSKNPVIPEQGSLELSRSWLTEQALTSPFTKEAQREKLTPQRDHMTCRSTPPHPTSTCWRPPQRSLAPGGVGVVTDARVRSRVDLSGSAPGSLDSRCRKEATAEDDQASRQ